MPIHIKGSGGGSGDSRITTVRVKNGTGSGSDICFTHIGEDGKSTKTYVGDGETVTIKVIGCLCRSDSSADIDSVSHTGVVYSFNPNPSGLSDTYKVYVFGEASASLSFY